MTNRKILILLLFQILPSYCLGSENEKLTYTICEVQKIAYVHIEPYNSKYKGVLKSNPTNFQIDEKPTGETYSLVLEERNNEKFINLYYKSKKNPDLNWDVKNIEKADGTKILFMNDDPQNLVLKTFSIKFSQEQTYYFNLDNKGNGFMSMINMRWNSFLDSINGQSLYFCTCKGLK
ncbi:MAG: hypothetical protein EBY20_02370 [Alphaproteobacteria bacterium]|nr:hypothetical protein [Alphaproteobacteria bacterium]